MISHISFASIPVIDPVRARDFWRDVMGLTVVVDMPAGTGRWIMLEVPGARTRLHLDEVAAIPPVQHPVLPLIAADVAGVVEALRGRGVAVVREPGPAEWDAGTSYAMIRDSEGNQILIASR